MKIALTAKGRALDSKLDQHFGRAPFFIIYDVDQNQYDVVDNTDNVNAVQGAGIQAGKLLVDHGVEAVITGQVGPKAATILGTADITIYESQDETVQAALKAFQAATLKVVKPVTVK